MIFEILNNSKFPQAYEPLAEQLEEKSLFFSSSWFNNFIETVVLPSNGQVLWLGCKSEDNKPLLLWPVWLQQKKKWHPVRLTALANYYTTLFEPLEATTNPQQLELAINRVTQEICKLSWDYLDLFPLNPKSPVYNLIIQSFRQQKKHVEPYFLYGNWYLLTENQTYDAYFNTRRKKLRNSIRTSNNRLNDKKTAYKIVTESHDLETALSYFHKTYLAAWDKEEPFPEFIPNLAHTACQKGWLRLGLMFIDDEIAAAQIWLTIKGTSYIYKVCRDPKFNAYSPGTLLTNYLIEYVFSVDNVKKIDFLTGDDHYKQDWMSHREERWGLQISNIYSFYGVIRTVKNFSSDALKYFLSNRNIKSQ